MKTEVCPSILEISRHRVLYDSTSKHRNRVGCIRWPCLRHIPVLHDTRPVHAVYVGQRNRLRKLIHLHMNEPNIGVKAVAQNLEGGIGDDRREFGFVGRTALGIEGVVLDEIDSNVSLESFGHVLLAVERVDKIGEDGTLVELVGWLRRAVAESSIGSSSLEG